MRLRAVRDKVGSRDGGGCRRHPSARWESRWNTRCSSRGTCFIRISWLRNEDGVALFVGNDVDPEWRGQRRPVGRYISTGWIPGNLLAEGAIWVAPHLMTLEPEK